MRTARGGGRNGFKNYKKMIYIMRVNWSTLAKGGPVATHSIKKMNHMVYGCQQMGVEERIYRLLSKMQGSIPWKK